jgi:DNA-binding NarL/FixJ family response regulator
MTKLMEKALEAVRDWPQNLQDEAAQLLLALDELGPASYVASEEELRAIDEALEQVERGERATAPEVEAAFARFRK